MTREQANAFVGDNHRHHPPVHADKFRCGITDNQGKLVGVIQVGRPVARGLDDGETVEVVRLCTDGSKNACSFLYAKMARVAKELGYKRIVTYILGSESGCTLKAAGWKFDGMTQAKSWNCKSRPRGTKSPTCEKQRWIKYL